MAGVFKRIIILAVLSVCIISFCVCWIMRGEGRKTDRAAEYEAYFMNIEESHIRYSDENDQENNPENDPKNNAEIPEADCYKTDYLTLMAFFMAGGFTTKQNLDYLNDDYPQEFYEYALEDLDKDGIPELMLSYRYNGAEQTFWEIFGEGESYDDCYIGSIRYFDRKDGILFDGCDGYDMYAYKLEGHRLMDSFSYYIEDYPVTDDRWNEEYKQRFYYEQYGHAREELIEEEYQERLAGYYSGDVKIKGKRLDISSLADDLGVSTGSIKKELACSSYSGLLHYISRNGLGSADVRYALANIDGDGISELIAMGEATADIYFYMDGRLMRLAGGGKGHGSGYECFYYPGRNIVKVRTADRGCVAEEYLAVWDDASECILCVEKEPVVDIFREGYKRDRKGNVQFNYYLDEEISDEDECDVVRDRLYKVFGLEEEIRFDSLESRHLDGMITYLEHGKI